MYLPQIISKKIPRILPSSRGKRALADIGIYVVVIIASIALAFGLRDYSLSRLSAIYNEDVAVLSPATLTESEISKAYESAMSDSGVREALKASGAAKLIVHVVPQEWYLPDLPLESEYKPGGHHVPENFDRRYYKLLFTKARTHKPRATGKDIVKAAYGRDPLLLVNVDIQGEKVIGIETPPQHVHWGDIPTPMF
jgi:hypothetical protein